MQESKLLFGTTNNGKLEYMKKQLSGLGIPIIGLHDLDKEIPQIAETGTTLLENARIKALGYYRIYKIPVFSYDTGLYFDEVPDDCQPGIFVRRVNGKYLSDDEMIAYYGSLSKEYGGLTARYKSAVCLVINEHEIHSYDGDSLTGKEFLIMEKPHPKKIEGFPIDRLSVQVHTGCYYYDLEEEESAETAMGYGVVDFFKAVSKFFKR